MTVLFDADEWVQVGQIVAVLSHVNQFNKTLQDRATYVKSSGFVAQLGKVLSTLDHLATSERSVDGVMYCDAAKQLAAALSGALAKVLSCLI